MTFEQRFAEFIQKNPALAVAENAKVTLTVKQLKKVLNSFWKAGRDTATTPESKSLFENIFGSTFR